ncbi:MAG: regulatory iron-sulfur-containing complex subunit RicT [Chloroflexota bacterium]|nr:regulatory iron-sulfur-containing complex subunit RicT [Chloroflexota bacterium]
MTQVVGVRFENTGKVYYFAPQGLDLNLHDWVVVETVQGRALGQVVTPPRQLREQDWAELGGSPDEIKPVLRLADSHDLLTHSYYRSREEEALERCKEKVAEHELDMKVVKARYSFNGERLTFYFTADHRVDFRTLVRDLAHDFRAHVELRQLGPRDELKLLDGLGPCGRPLCCNTWMTNFKPISIRMAKAQGFPLNPESISGLCGRLRCCLSFEYERYRQQEGDAE